MIGANDREIIQQLFEDVDILSSMIGDEKNPSSAAARAIVAPILRRWVCERLLLAAQRIIRPQHVHFTVYQTPVAVDNCRQGLYEHWVGFLSYGGVVISSALPKRELLLPGGATKVAIPHDTGGGSLATVTGTQFFEQPIFYWGQRLFSRREVLSVHANKLGGVHLDFRRGNDDTHIEELQRHFGIEVKDGPNLQMLVGEEIRLAKADPRRRLVTYDTLELVAIDTARIFIEGVRASQPAFASCLQGAL